MAMLCPKCHDQVLVVLDRDGIEIDYCGGCRGVWLDRGELDKLIARAASAEHPCREALGRREGRGRPGDRSDFEHEDEGYRGRRGRRVGFLSELFDFD